MLIGLWSLVKKLRNGKSVHQRRLSSNQYRRSMHETRGESMRAVALPFLESVRDFMDVNRQL